MEIENISKFKIHLMNINFFPKNKIEIYVEVTNLIWICKQEKQEWHSLFDKEANT